MKKGFTNTTTCISPSSYSILFFLFVVAQNKIKTGTTVTEWKQTHKDLYVVLKESINVLHAYLPTWDKRNSE